MPPDSGPSIIRATALRRTTRRTRRRRTALRTTLRRTALRTACLRRRTPLRTAFLTRRRRTALRTAFRRTALRTAFFALLFALLRAIPVPPCGVGQLWRHDRVVPCRRQRDARRKRAPSAENTHIKTRCNEILRRMATSRPKSIDVRRAFGVRAHRLARAQT